MHTNYNKIDWDLPTLAFYKEISTLVYAMKPQYTSDDINRLAHTFIKVLVERTGSEINVPLRFIDVYNDACTKQGGSNNKYETNTEIRHHVRDNLLKNGFIFVDPEDVDSVFLTQKAIDEYVDR